MICVNSKLQRCFKFFVTTRIERVLTDLKELSNPAIQQFMPDLQKVAVLLEMITRMIAQLPARGPSSSGVPTSASGRRHQHQHHAEIGPWQLYIFDPNTQIPHKISESNVTVMATASQTSLNSSFETTGLNFHNNFKDYLHGP